MTAAVMLEPQIQNPADAEVPLAYRFAEREASRILDTLSRVDVRAVEGLDAAAAVEALLRGPLPVVVGAVRDAGRLMASLPELVGGSPRAEDDAGDDFDLVVLAGPGDAREGDGSPASRERFCEEVDVAFAQLTDSMNGELESQELANICVMLVRGLREVRAQLTRARAERSKWALITAIEEGRRKAQRALRAGLGLAARLAGMPPPSFIAEHSELASAQRVRELLMTFRADVLRMTDNVEAMPPSYVEMMARDAHLHLLSFIGHPHYHELRGPDRFQVQSLRARLAQCLTSKKPSPTEAAKVLLDLHAFAGLLSAVNSREVLVVHDRAVKKRGADELEALLAGLSMGRGHRSTTYAIILSDLTRMRGRDPDLDEHVRREQQRGGEAGLASRALRTLLRLSAVRT